MDLRYLWIQVARPRRDYVFIVLAEEEARVRAAVESTHQDAQVAISQTFELSDPDLVGGDVLRAIQRAGNLVLSSSLEDCAELARLALEAHVDGVRVCDVETALLEIDPTVSSSSPAMLRILARKARHQSQAMRLYTQAKNFLEPVLAILTLIVLSPVILAVAAAIRLTSPGPILYRQKRVGLGGRVFEIIKFRSMRVDAEKNGPVWASARTGDTRLTPIGAFLRASHLDEIPQFWNIARGEVSLIGPRPERPEFYKELEKSVPLFKLRTLVKPGCTGWAQIRQGYANSVEDSRRKLEYDMFYVLRHSPSLDLAIVLGTVRTLFSGGTEGHKRSHEHAQEARMSRATPPAARPGLRVARRLVPESRRKAKA